MLDYIKEGFGTTLGAFLAGLVLAFILTGQIPLDSYSTDITDSTPGIAAREGETESVPEVLIKDEIWIESVTARQEIYEPGDNATVDITVKTGLKEPYNLSVDWLHNGTRTTGWTTQSSNYHNVSLGSQSYYSWTPLPDTASAKGDWIAHVEIAYYRENQTVTTDDITEFQVQ